MRRAQISETEYAALKKAGRTFREAGGPAQLPDHVTAMRQKAGKIPHTISYEDGFKFESDSERGRYGELKLLQAGGVIRNLKVKTKWGLVVNGKKVATYTDDFNYEERRGDGWEFVVEDYKNRFNAKDRGWRRTEKLMLACHGIRVRVTIG